ncbi:Protein required for attachment to host cell [Rubellimicrobium thermophilum DSM 16684]|uniref:Protein required for attachment to host cell n=1 Tax=Rubellimicrobium thermophilum DSM 16684 TaxID=1123069 RepID=S9SBF7_9RHOB|nr:host attachment family protein [Rubellimicrobium thermophilum]EPX87460.1 Protein required for attachment to host cell [Rubellimicrobium thermophilum DSM 16684]
MARLQNGTWVLVLDGEKALILRNTTDGQDPALEVVRKEEQDNPPDRDQKSDRPGRYYDAGAPGAKSAYEETDYHRLEKERFAEQMAGILYKAAHGNRFERLVIVAGPQILGALRPALHKEVAARIVAEIPKTMTGHPVDQIEKLLKQEMASA